MTWDRILYDAGSFTAALFLLEYGADCFIDHSVIVANRLGVSQVLVALLTAGAEWEELAVVVASLLQNRSELALGNVVGSSISNIIGAFSLGLLFHPGIMTFDRSAKIYTTLLFLTTSVFTVVALTKNLNKIAGGIFIGVFAVYIVSIGYFIYKGALAAPDDSDCDDSDDDDDDEGSCEGRCAEDNQPTERTSLLPKDDDGKDDDGRKRSARPRKHTLLYHVAQLILGFLALSISGYILSHASASLADVFNLSGTVLGVTILSFATTLPEKFVAVMGSARGHGGIVVATTAGSNIFLLTLCLGITLVAGNPSDLVDSLLPFELIATWTSSALFLLIVLLGSRQWMGGVLLALYFAFIALEFTLYRR